MLNSTLKFKLSHCILLITCFLSCSLAGAADDDSTLISTCKPEGFFTLAAPGRYAPLCISTDDWPGVVRALTDLQTDISRVTGHLPELITSGKIPRREEIVIAGTIGKSPLIDRLIRKGRINVTDVAGRWECYLIETVDRPFPGVEKALVIAGSDKRGTIYGIYQISEEIGISPWYWWADVPVRKSDDLYISPERRVLGEPSVKYRGIFLNDEAPALTNWIAFKYGIVKPSQNPPVPGGVANYGSEFYSRIFELILRLKGNYLWPAMWNNAFNEDDPLNAKLADEYGVVMGTSHQEPMLRAQKEWDRRYQRTLGSWNWTLHSDTLIKFWREGIRRNKNFESIITMGLRGADDTEMGPGGPAANMAKLEKIVSVQRKIISEEINTDVTLVPQMWCLYKEVQDYYNAGLRVPDDVTLLWAEDNWGNVRRLPTPEERSRSGGAGVYYHFDYHGGPRSYQWINTNPIPKIWDQMSLAKQYGADRIWIVNVGHFKGYEFPLQYFMSLAWNTEAPENSDLTGYTRQWAEGTFGKEHGNEIADLIANYTRFNGRRKPELLSPFTYSLVNYREAEKVVDDYKALAARSEEIYTKLPEEMRDAYYQLVLFPIKACALVNELYVTAGKNALFAKQGRAMTNEMALKTERLFTADTSLMGYYNRSFAGGKWNHFMDQSHLGYTNWADPPFNSLRAIKLNTIEIPDSAALGVAVEGSEEAWPGPESIPELPEFDIFNKQEQFIELFNKGDKSFSFTAASESPWILLSELTGTVKSDKRLLVTIDWDKVPVGRKEGFIKIKGAGSEVAIRIKTFNPAEPRQETLRGFVEAQGYVSVEAEHYTLNRDAGQGRWERIEDYGKTLSAMRATTAVDAPPAVPGKDSPCLEYQMYLFSTGEIETVLNVAPTLNFIPGRDLRIGVSFDDETPQIITAVPGNFNAQNGNAVWEKSVMNNALYLSVNHTITEKGYHTLRIWMIDPGLVLEKIIVNTGGVKPSYLGPPESFKKL
ncbi:MAG TPA: glycosyl hydrolase 115 family protein [Bacteroidales bacterium]|nr:glycosyl hydrolase 115 family protein [Bacteroidales bacterium]